MKKQENKQENIDELVDDLSWEFEGKRYPLFLSNGTGGIGMPIMHPSDNNKQVGVLAARFAWENSEPFIDHLDIETIDKASKNDDWAERENKNMALRNAQLFKDIVVDGSYTPFDELGEARPAIPKNRKEMLAYRGIVQSDLIQFWLTEFHVERYLPDGVDSIDAFLSNPTEVLFTVKIGSYNEPQHLLLIECDAPTDEQISSYNEKTFSRSQNNNGDWKYSRDNERMLQFAKKHITGIKGVCLGKLGELDLPLTEIEVAENGNAEHLKRFKRGFNPEWLIKIGEELANAFSLGKK
jgi:hypothetical protein